MSLMSMRYISKSIKSYNMNAPRAKASVPFQIFFYFGTFWLLILVCVFFPTFWAAAPEGAMSCRIQGKSVRPSVCPSVHLDCPFIQPPQPAIVELWMDGWMDQQTNGRTDFPCILQDIVPFGSTALPTSELSHSVDGQGKGTANHLLPLASCHVCQLEIFKF